MPAKRNPSGKPLRKEVTWKHWEAVLANGESLNFYCYHNKVYRSELILGMLKHFPQEWDRCKGSVGPILQATCQYCGRPFYPNIGRQKFCCKPCREHAWLAVPEHMEKNRVKVSRSRARRKAEKERQIASGDETQNSEG